MCVIWPLPREAAVLLISLERQRERLATLFSCIQYMAKYTCARRRRRQQQCLSVLVLVWPTLQAPGKLNANCSADNIITAHMRAREVLKGKWLGTDFSPLECLLVRRRLHLSAKQSWD